MKTKYTIFLTLLISMLLYACQKDNDMFTPDPGGGPDTAWHNIISNDMYISSLRNDLLLPFQIDSIKDVTDGSEYFTSSEGVTYVFPRQFAEDEAGNIITRDMQVEYSLLEKKGDMIRMNKSTVSENRLLISEGHFFVRLEKNSQNLRVREGWVIGMDYPISSPTHPDMNFFYGDESNTENFTWRIPDNTTHNSSINPGNNPNTPRYLIISDYLRWISCSRFFDTTGINRTTITTNLPSHFTNANTMAFVVFKNMNAVVNMPASVVTRKFTTFPLPVNEEIKVVVISKQAGGYYYGATDAVTTAGVNNNQNITVNPTKKSLADIKALLAAL